MSFFSVETKLLAADRLDVRDVLRDAVTAADAEFAALYVEDLRVEFAGDVDFAPRDAVFPTRSIPEVLRVKTNTRGTKPAVVLRLRLDRFHRSMVLVVAGHEAPDVIAIDAAEEANRRVERILAAVADRRT